MSTRQQTADALSFYVVDDEPHPESPSTMLGFWIYLMSDCLIFSMLFATYAVLGGNYAGGPGPKDLFDLQLTAINTYMLLFSSITYGLAMLAMKTGRVGAVQGWLTLTGNIDGAGRTIRADREQQAPAAVSQHVLALP